MPDWLEQVKAKPPWISLGLLGALLVLGGVFSIMLVSSKQIQEDVVIEKVGEGETGGRVVVDIGGAVEKPGVYELKPDARINEALGMAGGLGETADREWVEKNLNLAAKLVDGQKIYIPFIGEEKTETDNGSKLINVNTASISQLDTLWGVGEATAKKIIDNRPYGAVEELLTKEVLKSNVYEAVKDKVSVY